MRVLYMHEVVIIPSAPTGGYEHTRGSMPPIQSLSTFMLRQLISTRKSMRWKDGTNTIGQVG